MAVVSSEAPAVSLPDQRAWAQETCTAQGWTLDRIFEDATTGKRGVRRLMTEMIAALRATPKTSRPQWVLMTRVDRVGRGRIADSQIALHAINDLGVRIWTRDKGEIKLDTAMDQLINAAMQATAEFENEVRRDKAQAYYGKRRKAGAPSITNKRCYGLRVVKGGQLEIVPGEAEVIRRIFEMRIAGAGATTIGRTVRAIAPAPLRADGSPRKSPPLWMPWTIVRMLKNRKYCGTIVDEVTWQRAQILPTHLLNRHWDLTPVYPWPLAGAIRCWCGAGLFGQPGGRPPKKIRYYLCNRMVNHPEGRKNLRAEKIEAQFLRLLRRIEADPDAYHQTSSGPSPALIDRALRSARAEAAEIGRQRAVVWEMSIEGQVRREDVQERLDALARIRDEIAARIATLEAEYDLAVAAQQTGRLAAETIARAIAVWSNPVATALEQREIATALALYFGGLWVDSDAILRLGQPPARELRLPG